MLALLICKIKKKLAENIFLNSKEDVFMIVLLSTLAVEYNRESFKMKRLLDLDTTV